ncbi:MAG TPA: c-type cytochrome [Methylomirabilota bacterium]|nr:c-type cytochrome [Methylomirabilota bacterium]
MALGAAAAPPSLHAQAVGDAARGQQTFAAKLCSRCHQPRGRRGVGPPLDVLRRPQGAYELAGRLWNHAPAMFTLLGQQELPWPAISEPEMADLMAYLQADPRRDGPADLGRGQTTLIAKGCLKCHAWHGEGAKVGPDLSTRLDRLAPAVRWATTLWAHAPRMAQVAIAREVLYPRFSGDEMANLIGFLLKSDSP